MDRIWAPWRIEYILNDKPAECILCAEGDGNCDRERLVLLRTPHSLVMVNRYPYTNGHLMIAPRRHTADMGNLMPDEMLDLFKTLNLCRIILQDAASPQGFNIGMNLGRAAGAGIDDHLHIHIVPRWNGDTNFMTVLGDLRVMPENLLCTYDNLLPLFLAAHDESPL